MLPSAWSRIRSRSKSDEDRPADVDAEEDDDAAAFEVELSPLFISVSCPLYYGHDVMFRDGGGSADLLGGKEDSRFISLHSVAI